uniref:Uncharacterized protein n=1 Tax=Tetraselmis sp. GSL018 TaxID=582737 RepID=A0A061QJL3_9CHLO
MLGYLWGRWWESCVAPLTGVRWGGSGRFSNKGVLPPYVRLRRGFAGGDREEPPERDAVGMLRHPPAGLPSLPAWAGRARVGAGDPPPAVPWAEDTSSSPPSSSSSSSSGARPLLRTASAYEHYLESGLLEALDESLRQFAGDSPLCFDAPEVAAPDPPLLSADAPPARDGPASGASLWESVDWSPSPDLGGERLSLFTSDPLHSMPVDGRAGALQAPAPQPWLDAPLRHQAQCGWPEPLGRRGGGPQSAAPGGHLGAPTWQQHLFRQPPSPGHQAAAAAPAPASIQHQARILGDMIASRLPRAANCEELAQLSAARQLLRRVAGDAAAASWSPPPVPHARPAAQREQFDFGHLRQKLASLTAPHPMGPANHLLPDQGLGLLGSSFLHWGPAAGSPASPIATARTR